MQLNIFVLCVLKKNAIIHLILDRWKLTDLYNLGNPWND